MAPQAKEDVEYEVRLFSWLEKFVFDTTKIFYFTYSPSSAREKTKTKTESKEYKFLACHFNSSSVKSA